MDLQAIKDNFKSLKKNLNTEEDMTAETQKKLMLLKVKAIELEIEIIEFFKNPSVKNSSQSISIGDNNINNVVINKQK